jgi:hypothetical protein
MRIRVFGARCEGGTIAIGTGKDIDTGEEVSFGGEPRPMRDVALAIAEAAIEDDLPIVEIEDWQVL